MDKIFIIIVFAAHVAIASEIEEALLGSCQVTGHALYSHCVVVLPVTPEQVTYCTTLFTEYTACSVSLNQPEPMLLSKDQDPYVLSPYDPCRYEVQHYILGDICPSSPVDY